MRRFIASEYSTHIIIGMTLFLLLYFLGLNDYLIFHTIAEFFSIIVAFSIFMVVWNSRWFLENAYFLFIGISFLFVSGLDLLHALAYEGVGIFESTNNNLAMQLWIAARYLQSGSFLVAPLLLKKRLNTRFVFIGYFAIFLFVIAAIFYSNIFPETLVGDNVITPFKKASDLAISFLYLLSLILLLRRKEEFDRLIFKLIASSLVASLVSELCFLFYGDPYSIFNMAGLFLKIIAFYLIYKAVIEIGLQKPYRLFLRDVKQHEEALVRSNDFNKTLLNTIPFFMDIIDEEGNILFLNKKLASVFGESTIGKKCWDVYRHNRKRCSNCPLKNKIVVGYSSSIETGGFWGEKTYKIIYTGMIFQGKKAILEIFRDITKQKTVEGVMKDGRLYAESIVNTVRMPLVVLDFDLKIISANWFFYRSYGFLEEETVGNKFYEIYDNYWDLAELRKKLEDLVKLNISILDLEIVHSFPSIGRRTLLFTARRIYEAGYQKQKILLSISDITERKNWEDRIAASEERYRNLFDTANDAIITIDVKNNAITSWNSSAEKIFGWTAEEVIGKSLPKLIVPPDMSGEREKMIKDVLQGKDISAAETIRLRKDGTRINVSLSFFRIINAKKEVIGLCGIIRDITRRKENERKLKLHAKMLEKMTNDLKKFQLAVANASDLIIITNSKGIVIYANDVLEKITGYSKKEVIGKNTGTLWNNQIDTAFHNNLLKTIKEEKKPFVGELVSFKKNGEKYYSELRVSPILSENNEVMFFVAIERDITKEKEINRAKTEFVSIASHELRTPLANMSLSIEMLLDNIAGELNGEQKNYLRGLHNDVKGMTELVDALLNISRIELGTLVINSEPTNIVDIVDAVLNGFASQIKKKELEIKKEYAKNIPIISTDRNIMRIIIRNIFSNSIKYTSGGGKINCLVRRQENEVIIKISDNGCGIPQNQQNKIFEKLFRANNAVKITNQGVGLGLYIVKSMLERCGGRVWFEAEENKGATFYIAIPLGGMEECK